MPDDAADAQSLEGRAPRRREDPPLLTGRGQFVSDLRPEGALTMQIVRAEAAPARVVAVDVSAAAEAALVLTAADLPDGPRAAVNRLLPEMEAHPSPILVRDIVDAVGQPVAAVVAENAPLARDLAEGLLVELEECSARFPRRAFTETRHAGSPEAAFARADRVVEVTVDHAPVAPFALEPRAACALPDAETGGLICYFSTQTPHRCAGDLAAILGLPAERVRVIAPDVGGAFGGKASIYPEDVLVALAAMRLGRPVTWTASRSEEFLAASHGRGGYLSGRLALDTDGRFRALQADIRFPLGAWMPYSAVVPARNAARILPGPYEIADIDVRAVGELTHAAPVNIYRGAGRPEAAMLMERLVEAAARATGIDGIELRRRNLIRPETLPKRSATGELLDTGDYPVLLDRLTGGNARDRMMAARDSTRAEGRIAGVGTALYIEPCGAGFETAQLAIDTGGQVIVRTGSTAQGQGRETVVAAQVALALGLPQKRISVEQGDSAALPEAIGALASRSTAIGGSAVSIATDGFLKAASALAAEMLQQPGGNAVAGPEGFTLAGQVGAFVSWADLGAEACRRSGRTTGLQTPARFDALAEAWASGAVMCMVEIDAETGVPTPGPIHWVDDAGTVLNPVLVEGQLVGGLAQGVGEALMERIAYDGAQLITGSLMDYQLPRAADIPPVHLTSHPVPSAANPLGVKGVGEAGCIGVPAAIANAIHDALAPFGITDLPLPLTAPRIWTALRSAGEHEGKS